MVDAWRPGDCDALGNPLRLCLSPADCPYPCKMTSPHLHSIILPQHQKAIEQAAAARWWLVGDLAARVWDPPAERAGRIPPEKGAPECR
jgi:hypothetical protein